MSDEDAMKKAWGDNREVVYLLTIRDRDGSGWPKKAVFSSEENGRRYLGDWCRASWVEQGHDSQLPDDDTNAIRDYFEFYSEELAYNLDAIEFDPAISDATAV